MYRSLKNYYYNNYRKLVFLIRKEMNTNSSCVMYLYDYNLEFENFSRTFVYYLPLYADSYDLFRYYSISDDFLLKKSKEIWKLSRFDKDINTSGIYGEVLLDFYVRIVSKNEIFSVYASKSSYNNRSELKGIDTVGLECINEDCFNFIFAEAKFVANLSNAKQELISDICGKSGHLNSLFLNDYYSFAMRHCSVNNNSHGKSAKKYIDNLNEKVCIDGMSFIEAVNFLNYKIKFVYFAVFASSYKDPSSITNHYDDILTAFYSTISSTGIKNYDIEIVLIPTNNVPKEIKKKMREAYE